MKFFQFALKNLIRSKSRTILTILSITVATATLFIVLSLDRGYKSAVNTELVENIGAHLFISREGCPMEVASVIAQGGISPLFVPQDITEKLKNIKYIKNQLPFKIFAITTSDGLRTDIFMGVTDAIQSMRTDWQFKEGGWFTNENSIILGSEIARIENRTIGDKVYFEHFDREFIVSGILKRNNTQDDGTFFFPLEVAQKLIHRENKLSAIAVQIDDIAHLEDAKIAIRASLAEDYYVITAKDLSEGVMKFFGSTRIIMLLMVIVSLIVCTIGIINTMLMTAIERRKEFAYLKCVGASFTDIIRLIVLETLSLTIIAVIPGLIAGFLLIPSFEAFIRQFLTAYIPQTKIVKPDLAIVAISSLSVIIVGVLAALYPAIRASKIAPMEAIRND